MKRSDVVILASAVFLVSVVVFVGTFLSADTFGFDHKWHGEFVCPVDKEVFWLKPGGVCPTHGVMLETKVVRRAKDGTIESADKVLEPQPFGECISVDAEGRMGLGPCEPPTQH